MLWALSPLSGLAVVAGALSAGSLGYFLARPWAERYSSEMSLRGAPAFHEGWRRLRHFGPILTAMAVAMTLILTLTRPEVMAMIVMACFAAWILARKGPAWKKRREDQERRRRILEAFPQTLEMTVQSLQAGQTVPQALAYLSTESPAPLREEFKTLCLELELGSSPEDALDKLAARYDHPDLYQFVDSYRLSRLAGANLVRLYQAQWEGIEERHRVLRRLESMTAQARLSGLLMGVLPVLLLAVLFVMDPEMPAPLFDRPAGWAVLGLAVILEAIGFMWIRRLMRLEL